MTDRLKTLFAEYGCEDALQQSECYVPVENFKALRLSELDLAKSLALENLAESGLMQVSVSTKVRSSK